MDRERLHCCPLEIKAAQFYDYLTPVDRSHVLEVTKFIYNTCQDRGLGGRAVIVAFGGFCREVRGMSPRLGHSYRDHHDIDLGILLHYDFVGEPVFTEKLTRFGFYCCASSLGVSRIEESSRAESGGPNSYQLHFSEGLIIDITAPQRVRIEPRMVTTVPPLHNPPWLFGEWVKFQGARGWPFAVLADVTCQFTTW